MTEFKNKVNQIFNIAVYLKLMSSFVPDTNFDLVSKMVEDIYDFFKSSDEKDIAEKLPYIKGNLDNMTAPFLSRLLLILNAT